MTDGASPQSVTFLKGIVAGSVNLLIGCLIANQPITMGNVGPALLVGIFSYGFSIMLYVTSAQNLGATRGQIMFSTAPIWGVVLSYILYQGSFQWVHVISIVLLALAVIVTYLLSHKHLHTHVAMEHIHYHQHADGHHNHTHEGITIPEGKWHSHFHTHNPLVHEHPHYPDLHHRHSHN
ncbi:MAG: EamA family transporter [Bacteroidales bacterium]|nr:EamA family transporter [Bacteroidales bacterium]